MKTGAIDQAGLMFSFDRYTTNDVGYEPVPKTKIFP